MAKKRSHKKKTHHHRRAPHHKHKRHHRRRRHNPDTYMGRVGRIAGMGLAAIATGVGVYYGAAQIPQHPNLAMYGLPAAGVLLGAAVAKKMPALGVGIGVGAVSPFALTLAFKLLVPATPASTTSALARAARTIRAVDVGQMGWGAGTPFAPGMSAVVGQAIHTHPYGHSMGAVLEPYRG